MCVEYLRHKKQLVVVVLGGLGQICSDIEFLVLIELQARFLRGLELLRGQILHDKDVVGHHIREAARALLINLQLRRIALAVLCDQHVVFHLKVRRSHVRFVVMLLNSSLAITCSLIRHLCVDLGHFPRQLVNLHKFLGLVFCRPDQCGRICYVDDNSCLTSE
jgi:hypothetical protein